VNQQGNLQRERLVPDRVEIGFNRLGLLLGLAGVRRDELKLDVRVG